MSAKMKKVMIEYIGPHVMVDVAVQTTGLFLSEVEQGQSIEVDAESAELLLQQTGIWKASVSKTEDDKKSKSDKSDAPPTDEKKE